MSIQNKIEQATTVIKPSREEAEEAVRTLIKWAGDNPKREGLLDTPKRVVKAYEEFFIGYKESAKEYLFNYICINWSYYSPSWGDSKKFKAI